jgi:glucose/arabinose dehydrogenase
MNIRFLIIGLIYISILSPSTARSERSNALNTSIPFNITEIAKFEQPWALTFLPSGEMLVTEKQGRLLLVDQTGNVSRPISGLPKVAYGGQGGLGDVVLHPNYRNNSLLYFSYAEPGENGYFGAAVARAKLSFDQQGFGELLDLKVVWRQMPKVKGKGHYGHRIAFDSHGYLFISSGDRQKFEPAQDMNSNLGKILRLNDDGSIAQGNPFEKDGGVSAEIWSSGHRNPLGLAFDNLGRLWNTEMGPSHGDELNLVIRGENYGYPIVSNGNHYSGKKIPNHDTNPEFEAPKVWWKPTIAPAELIYYSGDMFPKWHKSFLIAGLRSKAIVRVNVDGDKATEVDRFDMGERIREIEQGPKGALWVLEDGKDARLLKLSR